MSHNNYVNIQNNLSLASMFWFAPLGELQCSEHLFLLQTSREKMFRKGEIEWTRIDDIHYYYIEDMCRGLYGDWFKLVPIVTTGRSQVPHILVYLILPWKGEFKFWGPEQKEVWLWLVRVVLQWWWNASDKPGEWLSRKQSAGFSPQSFSVSAFHNKKITNSN